MKEFNMRKDMEACAGHSKMEISLLSLSLLRLKSRACTSFLKQII